MAAALAAAVAVAAGRAAEVDRSETWRPAAVVRGGRGIAVTLSPGVVPCVVHVHGLRVPLAAGTPLTARYAWDFGDERGKYDRLVGFNAAHVYDRPGRYAITLTVTDEAGATQRFTAGLYVEGDHRPRVYVAADGSDANAGTAAEAPVRSPALAFKKLQAGGAVLFKAGGSYAVQDTLKAAQSDTVIGRYGDGPDPRLVLSYSADGHASGMIALGGDTNGVTIEHLAFRTPYAAKDPAGPAPKVGIDAVMARGRNLTVRDCAFDDVDTAINANGDPVGLLVEDCVAATPTSLRAYLVWGQGADHVYLGNRVANSTREHCIRMSGISRVLIAGNDLTNADRRPGDKDDYSKGDVEVHNGSYAYVVWNRATGGPIRVGPLGMNEPFTTATEWVVIDGNEVRRAGILAVPGSHHVMVRNNVVRGDNQHAIQVEGPSDGGKRFCADLTFANNTVVDDGPYGSLLKLWGHADGVRLVDNLFVAPHLTPGPNGAAGVSVVEGDLSSFTQVAGNVWPAVAGGGGTNAVGRQYLTAAQWQALPGVRDDRFANATVDAEGRPAADGPAVGRGVVVPGVTYDRDGHPRPTTGPAAGALEPVPVK